MNFLRRNARLLWAVLFLLGGGGQILHAQWDHCVVMCETGAEHSDSSDEGGEAPTHACKHAPGPVSLDFRSAEMTPQIARAAEVLVAADAAWPDPPVREIEHPPQLG